MKLLLFPKYSENGASSRYRMYQYAPYFKDYELEIYPFFDENYIPAQKLNSFNGFFYLCKMYLRRLRCLCCMNKSDVVFLQYQFTRFLPFNIYFFKLFKINFIVDYDDAIFHDYDQHPNKIVRFLFKNKIAKIISYADAVITGSPYLTRYAKQYNDNVFEIPTSIDMQLYNIHIKKAVNNKFIIGWIGSKTTSVNLISLIPAFNELKKSAINFEIRCIGFDVNLEHHFRDLPFKIIDWHPETEVVEINKFTVGIMPLEDNAFNKGKCAFKLIQYMACGLPTISTPLEANVKVNRGNNNVFANTTAEWTHAFIEIYKNPSGFKKVGDTNKKIVERYYSIQSNYEAYLKIFDNIVARNNNRNIY